jgi:biopolymer transport protein ExbB
MFPTTLTAAAIQQVTGQSFTELMVAGGPVMVPIGLCSVVALAFTAERTLRLRKSALGLKDVGGELVAVVRAGGPQRGLELCRAKPSPMARVMHTALSTWGAPVLEREKAVEEAGLREVRRLSSGLRPLVVVAAIAPLLGLLGTVWGMILIFSVIGQQQGLGRPELLADGISQALITTLAGLGIAIPTHAAYFWLKSRVERFTRAAEDLYAQLVETLRGAGEGGHAHP